MSLAGMHWDEAARFTAFYWRVPEPLDVGLCSLMWGNCLSGGGADLFVRKEVLIMLLRSIRAELMKCRRSPVWLAFVVLPLFPAILGDG